MGSEETDSLVRDDDDGVSSILGTWISDNLINLLGVLVFLWVLRKFVALLQHRWFPYVMHLSTKDEFVQLEEVKKDFFASLSTIVSHDPELRKQNAIKILEVGVGTGVNFPHYPEGSRLIVVDPNPNFRPYYEANRKKFPNVHAEDIIITTGDQMEMISEGSVDVVVITLLLCSIDKIEKTISEVRRVLAPNGKFYFMEHIAEFDLKNHWLRRKLQDVFTWWIPVWPFFYDGCCLNRDVLPLIQSAGFSNVQAEKYYGPVPAWIFDLEKPSLKGIATK